MAKEPLRGDVQAAVDRMSTKVGAGRELQKLPEHLAPGEQIEQLATGYYGKGTGLVVLTDRRLLFIFEGVMTSASEDFPLDRLVSIQWSGGVLLGSIIVHAGSQKATISNLDKNTGRRIVDQVRERLATRTTSAPPSLTEPPGTQATPSAGGIVNQLTKLTELHGAGVLTDEEFSAAKLRLLS